MKDKSTFPLYNRKEAIEIMKQNLSSIISLEYEIIESNTVDKDMELFYKIAEMHSKFRDAYSSLTRDLTLKYESGKNKG